MIIAIVLHLISIELLVVLRLPGCGVGVGDSVGYHIRTWKNLIHDKGPHAPRIKLPILNHKHT